MQDTPIAIWFLILSLFLPRLSLFIAWIGGQIPANNIPFLGDAILAILLPRILILIYIAGVMGVANVWFIVHAIVMAGIYLSGSRTVYVKKSS